MSERVSFLPRCCRSSPVPTVGARERLKIRKEECREQIALWCRPPCLRFTFKANRTLVRAPPRPPRQALSRLASSPDNLAETDVMLLTQHDAVFTLGTGSTLDNLRFDPDDAPFDVVRTERGGEVTYHGPGQVRYISIE